MKITPTQMHTPVQCRLCSETKPARQMRYTKRQDICWISRVCSKCYHQHRRDGIPIPKEVELFVPDEPEKFENMYQSHDDLSYIRYNLHTRKFMYKKYCKTHRRIQAELKAITEAGFSLTQAGECGRIDKWKQENL